MALAAILFESLEWDPGVIGVITVAIGVLVLCGSVYLLLATNAGSRLGFLLAFTGLAAWMLLMGIIWWVYAIGLIGDDPAWETEEILVGDQIVFAEIEDVRELPTAPAGESFTAPDDWVVLPDGDEARAEAKAVADEAVTADPSLAALYEANAIAPGDTLTTDDYVVARAFETGGERWPAPFGYDGKPFGWFHRPRHLVLQLQFAEPAPEVDLNAAPPAREPDPNAELISVVMTRDLGNRRLPPAMVTIASGLAFALGAWLLHRRDQAIWAREGAAAAR